MASVNVSNGAASLVFFYYGDSPFLTLSQETLRLKKALEGYGRSILLKHDFIPEPFDLSSNDEKLADVVDTPTADNLIRYLRELADNHHMIDLFIFSHGQSGSFRVSTGQHGSRSEFRASDITTRLAPAQTGLQEFPIRMIWSTLCFGESLNEAWRSIGAKVVSGAQRVNFYPNQFGKFAEAWNKGDVSYEQALSDADTATSRTLAQTYIATIHAPSTRQRWGGCPIGRTVLGKNPCAKDYFTTIWSATADEFDNVGDGSKYMNFASQRIIAGDRTLTKNSVPMWTATRMGRLVSNLVEK